MQQPYVLAAESAADGYHRKPVFSERNITVARFAPYADDRFVERHLRLWISRIYFNEDEGHLLLVNSSNANVFSGTKSKKRKKRSYAF